MSKLVNSFEHLKFIFDNLDLAISEREFIFDELGNPIDYQFVYANRTYANLIDRKAQDIIGLKATELYPNSKDYWIREYYEVVKTGVPLKITRYEETVERYYSVYIVKASENTFLMSFTDITEILKNAHKYDVKMPTGKMMKNITKIGVFEVNRLTYEAKVSNLMNEVVGIDKIDKGFFRKTILEITHPDHYNKISNIIKKILKGELSEFETEFRMFNQKKNSYHWVNFFIFPIEFDKKGIPFRYSGLVRDIEEDKRIIEESKEIEELFAQARRVANLTTFIYNVGISTFEQSKELSNFVGIDNLTTIEQFRKILHPDDLEEYNKSTEYSLSGTHDKVTVFRIIKDGKEKIIQSSVFGKTDSNGKMEKIFGILKDITEIELARRRAERAQKAFQQIFNASPSGIFLLDNNFKLTMENVTFRMVFKTKHNELTFSALLGEKYNETLELLKTGKDVRNLRIEFFINGKKHYFVINITKTAEEFGNNYEGTVVDITQQVLDEKRILYLATHDVLTDLYNRNYFEEIVTQKEKDFPLGLVLCDIDGLKLINDAFGHLKGDELLQSLAKTLKALSPTYIASRIGGDEFALLVDHADEEQLEKIEMEIKESIKDMGLFGINFEVSSGYAILTKGNSAFDKVFNDAENMMYRRKLTDRSSRKSNALTTIMQTLHEKTEETIIHCERVGDYASMLLAEAGYKRTVDLEDIRFLSDVHDIGKIAIPDTILKKTTKLSKDEYNQIKYHSEAGYKIIKNIIDNENIAFGILYHHERYDGTGYPHGLKEDEIPLYAKVLSIADAYDTMTRGRVYQKPISKEAALKDIEKNIGTQFDPRLAKMFIRIMKEKNNDNSLS